MFCWPRETPLNEIHLENMLALSRMGAVIAPPVPGFYNNPQTIDDLIDHTVGRVLDLFGLEMPQLQRWAGMHGVTSFHRLSKRPDNAARELNDDRSRTRLHPPREHDSERGAAGGGALSRRDGPARQDAGVAAVDRRRRRAGRMPRCSARATWLAMPSGRIRFVLFPSPTTTANLVRDGRLTLTLSLDGGMCELRMRARRARASSPDIPLACFEAELVEHANPQGAICCRHWRDHLRVA